MNQSDKTILLRTRLYRTSKLFARDLSPRTVTLQSAGWALGIIPQAGCPSAEIQGRSLFQAWILT